MEVAQQKGAPLKRLCLTKVKRKKKKKQQQKKTTQTLWLVVDESELDRIAAGCWSHMLWTGSVTPPKWPVKYVQCTVNVSFTVHVSFSSRGWNVRERWHFSAERKARAVSECRMGPLEAALLPSEGGKPWRLSNCLTAAQTIAQMCAGVQLSTTVTSNNKRELGGTLKAVMGLNDPDWLSLDPHLCCEPSNLFQPSLGSAACHWAGLLLKQCVSSHTRAMLWPWLVCSWLWTPWYWLALCCATKEACCLPCLPMFSSVGLQPLVSASLCRASTDTWLVPCPEAALCGPLAGCWFCPTCVPLMSGWCDPH